MTHNAIRGRVSGSALLKNMKDDCCGNTGLDIKMARIICPLETASLDRKIEENSLESCLLALMKEVLKSGGTDMAVVERLFSVLRALGLKMPFRLRAC